MLISSLLILLVAMPLNSPQITPNLFNRIVLIIFMLASLLTVNSFYYETIGTGIGIYSGLFNITSLSLSIDLLLFLSALIVLTAWAQNPHSDKISHFNQKIELKGNYSVPVWTEYGLILVFSITGSSLLISSSDLLSFFLSIELQSFGVYVLATLYRDSESSTGAGLKYFLLGGFSSALLLLGLALIYNATGLTQFNDQFMLIQLSSQDSFFNQVVLGYLVLCAGLLFKVAAAPFHNWAPDVYDGVPTIVTTWLTVLPKISIFTFLLIITLGLGDSLTLNLTNNLNTTDLNSATQPNLWSNMLLISSFISLLVGTLAGLAQTKIKRLLAFSTISHVGFLLLALQINSETSIAAFLFYLVQYTLTNLNTFLIILAISYCLKDKGNGLTLDINKISDLKGASTALPLLSFSFILMLFSMAGIPPLLGFFAKQQVLSSCLESGNWFLSLVAILVSVISACYYLRIVRTLYQTPDQKITITSRLGSVHALMISILSLLTTFFMLSPSVLLNSCHLLALSQFSY